MYFGFSFAINGRSRERTLGAIAAVPDDRLLLESDLPQAAYIDGEMERLIKWVMQAKGWTREKTAQVTTENAKRFFENCLNAHKKEKSKKKQEDKDDDDDDDCSKETNDEDNNDNNDNNDDDDDDDDDDDEKESDGKKEEKDKKIVIEILN